jgi:hypothetical protein
VATEPPCTARREPTHFEGIGQLLQTSKIGDDISRLNPQSASSEGNWRSMEESIRIATREMTAQAGPSALGAKQKWEQAAMEEPEGSNPAEREISREIWLQQ